LGWQTIENLGHLPNLTELYLGKNKITKLEVGVAAVAGKPTASLNIVLSAGSRRTAEPESSQRTGGMIFWS
jgi:Leucine-rich repeat (LRR) protein